jgi:hypothetical protein
VAAALKAMSGRDPDGGWCISRCAKCFEKLMTFHIAAGASGVSAKSDTGFIKMPDPKDDSKSSEWRPYIFARDQWHCRICGDRFLYSEMVRKHIADEHDENMPPSMYEYFRGAVWQRKKMP